MQGPQDRGWRAAVANRGDVNAYVYYAPAPQTKQENCVAHNGSIIPVPGRDIFAQAWYQGGLSVVDFTDSAIPVEIAFFVRGPIDEALNANDDANLNRLARSLTAGIEEDDPIAARRARLLAETWAAIAAG